MDGVGADPLHPLSFPDSRYNERVLETSPHTDLHPANVFADLREIARALSAAWDVDTTLDLIARKTAQMMRVDSCSIYLLESSDDTLWLRASTGLAQKAL